jgi:hypothetical protein
MVSESYCEPSSMRYRISKASFWQSTDDLSLIESLQSKTFCWSMFLWAFDKNIMGIRSSPLNFNRARGEEGEAGDKKNKKRLQPRWCPSILLRLCSKM